MKILILVTKGEVGGAQMSVLNLARRLHAQGKDITVGFGNGKFLKNKLTLSNIPFVQFNYLMRSHNPFIALGFIFELRRHLKKNKYSIIHFNSSNTLTGLLAAKFIKPKPKTIFTLRGLSMLDENYEASPTLKFLYKLYFKILVKMIDEPVFVSQANHDYALQVGISQRGTVVYNGLDPERLYFLPRIESRAELSSLLEANLENKFIIGSIGRLCYAKNFEFLINIFPRIQKIKPDAIVVIIGEGENKNRYRQLINNQRLEKNIILAGKIEGASKFMNAFDLFILPSRYEGLSITLIEALFAGSPILASRVGGNTEQIDDPGQLYELNNEKEFLANFKKLAENAKAREAAGEKNKLRSKTFHLENTVKNYLKLYQ